VSYVQEVSLDGRNDPRASRRRKLYAIFGVSLMLLGGVLTMISLIPAQSGNGPITPPQVHSFAIATTSAHAIGAQSTGSIETTGAINVAAHSLLIVGLVARTSQAAPTISDSVTDSFTQQYLQHVGTSPATEILVDTVTNAIGGASVTFSCHAGATAPVVCMVLDITNVYTSNAIDQKGSGTNGTSLAEQTGLIWDHVSTTKTNDMLVLIAAQGASTTQPAFTSGTATAINGLANRTGGGNSWVGGADGNNSLAAVTTNYNLTLTVGSQQAIRWWGFAMSVFGTAATAPTGLTVSSFAQTTVSLTWTNPNGESLVNNTVYYGISSVGPWTGVTTSGAVTAFTVTGLTPNKYYVFQVTAWNGTAESGPSTQAHQITATIPAAPGSFVVASFTTTSISYTWSNPSGGGLVNDTFYWQQENTCGATFVNSVSLGVATSYTLSSLLGATFYCAQVSAWNATGESPASAQLRQETAHVPSAPTTVVVTATTTTTVAITWVNPTGTVSNDTVYWNESASCNPSFYQNAHSMAGSATSYTITGLTTADSYCVAVQAWNATGGSALSSPARMPGAAASLGVTSITTTTVSLTWTAAAGSLANDTVYEGTPVATPSPFCTVTSKLSTAGSVSTYTAVTLTPGVKYCFAVVGWSSESDTIGVLTSYINATTTVPVPGAPTITSATVLSTSSISIVWVNPVPTYGSVVNNTVVWGTSCGSTTIASWQTSASMGGAVTTYTMTGLLSHTSHCIAVSAWTTGGMGAFSNTVTRVTFYSAPGAPTNLTLISTSRTTITFNWTNPNPAVIPLVNNSIYYRASATCRGVSPLTAISTGSAVSNYQVNGLSAATQYCFVVTAWSNGAQSAQSVAFLATTQGVTPPAPLNLAVTLTGFTFINVAWVNPIGYTLYNNTVYYQTGSACTGAFTAINTHGVTEAWNITGLTASTTYCITVTAWDDQSNTSTPVVATTMAVPGGGGGLVAYPAIDSYIVIGGIAVLAVLFLFIVFGRRRRW